MAALIPFKFQVTIFISLDPNFPVPKSCWKHPYSLFTAPPEHLLICFNFFYPLFTSSFSISSLGATCFFLGGITKSVINFYASFYDFIIIYLLINIEILKNNKEP